MCTFTFDYLSKTNPSLSKAPKCTFNSIHLILSAFPAFCFVTMDYVRLCIAVHVCMSKGLCRAACCMICDACGGSGGGFAGIRTALVVSTDTECEKVLAASAAHGWYESSGTPPLLRSSPCTPTLVHHCWLHRRFRPSRCHGQRKQEKACTCGCLVLRESIKLLLVFYWVWSDVLHTIIQRGNHP